MKTERVTEIRELFKGYNFVDVANTGWIKISLYPIRYDTNGLSKFIKVLNIINGLSEYNSYFDANVEMGYYDDVNDVCLDFCPKE